MKRLFDIVMSFCGLLAVSPVLLTAMFLVWLQDRHSPFYIACRVGRGLKPFRMVKLRSMVVNADKSGVDSTSGNDRRITVVGRTIRRFKLDELTQLWNVLKGEMSLVGPRPNVQREVDIYTAEEKRLLDVRPGVTDLASIVFADESDILEGSADPDIKYNQVIRPWKSRLGLFYIAHSSLLLDLKIVFLTALAVVSRRRALDGTVATLRSLGADQELIAVAKRLEPLKPFPPPGATEIVTSRERPPA